MAASNVQTSDTRQFDYEVLDQHIHHFRSMRLSKYEKWWNYYRNTNDAAAQVSGLPERLHHKDQFGNHKEIVIENDIAWRVHSMIDFMFAKEPTIQSLAASSERANEIELFLKSKIKQNGGMAFYQNMALLGSVYGFVDLLVRIDDCQQIVIEVIEAPKIVPILNANDYRKLEAYMISWTNHEISKTSSLFSKISHKIFPQANSTGSKHYSFLWNANVLEYHITNQTTLDAKKTLVRSENNRFGYIPVVHIQNISQPYTYEGISEVEPLISLQDELNTRLSDRANRVTFQAFKMYLGKGIEGFIDRPVGPGQMWATENLDAKIDEFGGDSNAPSETNHIAEVREALDKASGISPLVTGLVRDRVGNLTSENALRIVMMGLLAKTERKRINYGDGLVRLCQMILDAANITGEFVTNAEEKRIRIDWPEPMPLGESQRLINAERKLRIGVPQRQVLAELGYSEIDQVDNVIKESDVNGR